MLLDIISGSLSCNLNSSRPIFSESLGVPQSPHQRYDRISRSFTSIGTANGLSQARRGRHGLVNALIRRMDVGGVTPCWIIPGRKFAQSPIQLEIWLWFCGIIFAMLLFLHCMVPIAKSGDQKRMQNDWIDWLVPSQFHDISIICKYTYVYT